MGSSSGEGGISVVRVDVNRSDFDTKESLQKEFSSFAQKLSSVSSEKVRLFIHFKGREGQTETGVDYGGLAKEYLRLLIKSSLNKGTAKEDTAIFLKDEEGNLNCKLREGSLDQDRENLKNLGKIIMASCLSTNTRTDPWQDKLITGCFFNKSLIDKIKLFDSQDFLESPENISADTRGKLLQAFEENNPLFKDYLALFRTETFGDVNVEALKEAKDILTFDEEVPDKFEDESQWQSFRQGVIHYLEKEFVGIEALHALGQGMLTYIPRDSDQERKEYWDSQWKTCDSTELSEKIQGRFDRTEIAQMFKLNPEDVPERSEAFQSKAGYLADFIHDKDTSDQDVKDLISFVTGAESLPPGVRITLKERRIGAPSALPYTHTCANQLDLWHESISPNESNEYGDDSYENFVKTLRVAIRTGGFGHI
jgi:hypothetical protein